MATRILITGDRRWYCPELARLIMGRLRDRYVEVTIIEGGEAGVDTAFAEAALGAGCGVRRFPADWDQHGKDASPLRNQEMVDSVADFAIAVHRNLLESKGTKDCVKRCLAAGIPVWLIDNPYGYPRKVESL